MKYWKYIDVPEFEELHKDLAAWFTKNPHGLTGERWNEVNLLKLLIGVPRLGIVLRSLGVRATYAVAIVLRENDRPIIHIDRMPNVHARILFPVMNTEGTYTAFYETDSPGTLITDYDVNKESLQFQPEEVTEVTRFALTRPVILRVDRPHAVICESNEFPRVTLSIRFDKDPLWMLE
jgi:hypothetical protein